MTVSLGPLVVEAADLRAVADFWAVALGPCAQQALLSFRPQAHPKTVKNRVHLDGYLTFSRQWTAGIPRAGRLSR